jgi:hypothetical protein
LEDGTLTISAEGAIPDYSDTNHAPWYNDRSSITRIIVENSVTGIGAYAFDDCSHLTELTLPFIGKSLNASGADAILGVLFGTTAGNGLKAVTQYYDRNHSVTYYLPLSLAKLTVTLPATLIEYGALYNCSMLQKLTIASSIEGIKGKALYGCSGIKDFYSQSAMPPNAYSSIAQDVHSSCILHIPAGSKQYYEQRTGWKDFFFIQEEASIAITTHTLPLYGGWVVGINEYEPDAEASLHALANLGYTFESWTENEEVVGTSPTYLFTVTAPRTLYAVFAPKENADPNILVSTQPNSAAISWQPIEEATSYTLIIYSDANRTEEINRFQLDDNANELRSTQQILSYTVSDLDVNKEYYYSLTSYNSDYLLTVSVGYFSTPIVTGMDNPSAARISIYPNPVTDNFRISGIDGIVSITVSDISGKTVWKQTVAPNEPVSVNQLPKGVYIVNVNGKAIKIVK